MSKTNQYVYKWLSDALIHYIQQYDIKFIEEVAYKRSEDHPMIYIKAFNDHNSLITTVFKDNRMYPLRARNYDDMFSLLKKRKREEIRILEPDQNWCAFKNGAYNLSDKTFMEIIHIEANTPVIAAFYVEGDFIPLMEFNLIKIPLFPLVPSHDEREYEIRDKIARLRKGKVEVKTSFGRIDVMTHDAIIEVKTASKYKHALGQILFYSECFPSRKREIVLYGPCDVDRAEIVRVCEKYQVQVTFFAEISQPSGKIPSPQMEK